MSTEKRTRKPCPRQLSHKGVSHYKREGYGFLAEYRDPQDGARRTKSLRSQAITTKAAACKWARDFAADLGGERSRLGAGAPRVVPAAGESHLEAVGRLFLESKRGDPKVKSPVATCASYEDDLVRHIFPWGRAAKVASLQRLTIEDVSELRDRIGAGLNRRTGEPLAVASRNKGLRTARAFLNWCRKKGYTRLPKDDISDALEGFGSDQSPPEPLDRDALEALLLTAERYDQSQRGRAKGVRVAELSAVDFVLVVALTGLRRSEACSLEVENVELGATDRKGTPKPRLLLRADQAKTRKRRMVDLTVLGDPAVDLFRRLVAQAGGKYLFLGDRPVGTACVNSLQQRLRKTSLAGASDEIKKQRSPGYGGPGFNWQRLRQTVATNLIHSEIFDRDPFGKTAKLLGNSDAVLRRHYEEMTLDAPEDARCLVDVYALRDLIGRLARRGAA